MSNSVKYLIVVGIGALILTFVYAFSKMEHIQPGYVGVSVRNCGDRSGVSKDPIPTGYYWRSLFCETVVAYPISMRSLVLTKNPHEGTGGLDGQESDQSIQVNSSEGLPIEVDVALNFTLDSSKVPALYEKWRMDLDHVEHLYLRQTIREGLQNVFARYTAQQLYSDKKETSRGEVEAFLSDKLGSIGIRIQQFTINRIQPPASVVAAINSKVEMDQQAMRAQAEVRKKEAEAAQAVAVAEGAAKAVKVAAEGDAQAILVKAQAQAEANRLLSQSLTPSLIDYERSQKWDGRLPSVTGGVVPMMQFGQSSAPSLHP